MITNERQYRTTKTQLAKLIKALEDFNLNEVAKQVGSDVLGVAELNALKSEQENLLSQINEYESLRSGTVTSLTVSDLNELPGILIRARIARGLSQRGLAELMGLKEQQIQRYESDEYATANLRRLREIAEALKLNITEIKAVFQKAS